MVRANRQQSRTVRGCKTTGRSARGWERETDKPGRKVSSETCAHANCGVDRRDGYGGRGVRQQFEDFKFGDLWLVELR